MSASTYPERRPSIHPTVILTACRSLIATMLPGGTRTERLGARLAKTFDFVGAGRRIVGIHAPAREGQRP